MLFLRHVDTDHCMCDEYVKDHRWGPGAFGLATCNYLLSWELKDSHSSVSFSMSIVVNDLGIPNNS